MHHQPKPRPKPPDRNPQAQAPNPPDAIRKPKPKTARNVARQGHDRNLTSATGSPQPSHRNAGRPGARPPEQK